MQRYINSLLSSRGSAIANAQVLVQNYPAGTTATIYSDNGITVTPNPLTTDINGAFAFYAADGHYQLQVSGAGIASTLVSDIILLDPSSTLVVAAPLSGAEGITVLQSGSLLKTTLTTIATWATQTFTGFLQSGAGAVVRTILSKLQESVSVDDFGAVGDNITDDSGAIIKAQTALSRGGVVKFTPGKTYRVASAIPMVGGITYNGGGRSGIDLTTKPGAKIVSSVSPIFTNTASTITGVTFDGLWVEAETGGGHILDWSNSGIVAKVEVKNSILAQNNPSKSVINGVASGGIFSVWMHDFEYRYSVGNTVPAINIVSPTVNTIVIEKFWSTCSTQATSGTYSIWLESTNVAGPGINNLVRLGVFELPGGGSVNMLSCTNSGIEQCGVYDLSVAPNNPQFRVAKGASSIPSSACWVQGVRSIVGTAAKPDLQIDMSVSAQSTFYVEGCTLAWIDGVSTANGPGCTLRSNGINNFENIAYTLLGANATNDLAFNNTLGTSKSYSIWNGYAGNNEGYLNINQNGTYAGCISPAKSFQWGGTFLSPAFTVSQSGAVFAGSEIYPGNGAGAAQAAAGLLAGTGAPSNANGNNGDFYFRSDGGAGTSIYQKRTGTWVGIV